VILRSSIGQGPICGYGFRMSDGADNGDIPDGIGPHEGRELELMLAGAKPLAMFNDDLPPGMEPPEIAFDPYVAEGPFVKQEYVNASQTGATAGLRFYFYALPNEQWRIDRMIEIKRALFEQKVPTTPELETEIGRLLGYDDRDVQIFVERLFNTEWT
jgi:hypothetical protein